MTLCILSGVTLSAPAKVYRQLWADRWPARHPSLGGGEVPDGAAQLSADAYPFLRPILSADKELQVSPDLHLDVITRLAGTEPVVVITYDSERIGGQQRHL